MASCRWIASARTTPPSSARVKMAPSTLKSCRCLSAVCRAPRGECVWRTADRQDARRSDAHRSFHRAANAATPATRGSWRSLCWTRRNQPGLANPRRLHARWHAARLPPALRPRARRALPHHRRRRVARSHRARRSRATRGHGHLVIPGVRRRPGKPAQVLPPFFASDARRARSFCPHPPARPSWPARARAVAGHRALE